MKEQNNKELTTAIVHELAQAESLEVSGDYHSAFYHLERAHVLGQTSTYLHTRIHWRMFKFAIKQHSPPGDLGTDRANHRSIHQNAIWHLS